MDSKNIKHVPLNREGALELGIHPCSVCNCGWATYSNIKSSSCHDSCDYFKRFNSKKAEVKE